MEPNIDIHFNKSFEDIFDTLSLSSLSDDRFSRSSMSSESEDEMPINYDHVESLFRVKYGVLTIYGEGLPPFEKIRISYREAWRICKQGCLCVLRNFWDPKTFTVTYHATCDGTDPVNFLTLKPTKKGSKTIVISFWEVLNAYWAWKKCRLFYVPAKRSQCKFSALVIEGLSPIFYESLLKCVYECQVVLTSLKSNTNELHQSNF